MDRVVYLFEGVNRKFSCNILEIRKQRFNSPKRYKTNQGSSV